MGFKDTRKKLIDCLKEANFEIESRSDIETKNLFAIGEVTIDELIDMALLCRGTDYSTSEHHFLQKVDVHIMKPKVNEQTWYIKFYFIEPNVMFISVHR